MGGAIIFWIIVIVVVFFVVKSIFWDQRDLMAYSYRDIFCDGCGKMIGILKREYKEREHKAGLVKYYCDRCIAARAADRDINEDDDD